MTYLESPTRYAYSLYNLYCATMTIKGRLQVSMSNVNAVFWQTFPRTIENGPHNGGFGGKNWSKV